MNFKIFGKDSLREKFLCGFAVAMFATVIFAYFFAQNTSEITPHTAAVLASIIFTVSILSYIPALIIFRRAFPAMIFCVVCWLGFYISPSILLFFVVYWPWPGTRAICITFCILIVALVAVLQSRKVREPVKATFLFIGVLAVIFAMNFGEILNAASNANIVKNNNIPIKKDFVVDSNSKSPNIYWIHPDGMLGVDACKKYLGEDQKEFLSELKARGFEINNSASFEGRHSTSIAISVLMNPYTYDNWTRNEVLSLKKN